MKFFNPASLLASPEAAVTPPPQNDTASFLIGSALKEAGSLTKKYFDVKSLEKETNELAKYVGDVNPKLGEYLSNKASGYNIGQTDPAAERASLLKSITELHGMQIEQQKADNYSNATKSSQLYTAKLNFSQKQAADAQSAVEAWDQEYNKRKTAGEKNRMAVAKATGKAPPPLPAEVNPYLADAKAKQAAAAAVFNSTPDSVITQSPSARNAAVNPAFPAAGNYEAQPGGSADLFPGKDNPEATAIGELPSSPPVASSPDNPILQSTPPPVVNPDVLNLPETAAPAPPAPNTYNPAEMLPPGSENDPAAQVAAQVAAQAKAAVSSAVSAIQRQKISLSTQANLLYDPKVLSQLTEALDSAAAEIAALPNPGSDAWTASVNGINRQLSSLISNAPKITVAQDAESKNNVKNMAPVQFKIKATGKPVTMYVAKSAGGVATYRYMNGDGVLVPATEEDLKKLEKDESSTTTPSSTKPSIQSSIQSILQNAKINAK